MKPGTFIAAANVAAFLAGALPPILLGTLLERRHPKTYDTSTALREQRAALYMQIAALEAENAALRSDRAELLNAVMYLRDMIQPARATVVNGAARYDA